MIEFNRQPRVTHDIPRGDFQIESPPPFQEKPDISWGMIILPPMVMLTITILLALSMGSKYMLLSVVMTGMTLITSIISAMKQIQKYNKRKKLREAKYQEYITQKDTELKLISQRQAEARMTMYPSPDECIARIEGRDNRLFEKTEFYDDFLTTRIGIGTVSISVKLNYDSKTIQLEEDELENEPSLLAQKYQDIKQMPVYLDFKENKIVGITGKQEETNKLLDIILLQLMSNHGYDDLRIVLLCDEMCLETKEWINYIPHVWNNNRTTRYIGCGRGMSHIILNELHDEISNRDIDNQSVRISPRYVFIVQDESLLEDERIAKYLYNDHHKLGVYSLFVSGDQAHLPMHCRQIININGKNAEMLDKDTGDTIHVSIDQLDERRLERIGLLLSRIRLKKSLGAFEIPQSITLMDLYNINKVEEYHLTEQWSMNKTYYGIRVPIGVIASNKPLYFDLHETGHGPHGLVAGTTGSGKSELLQTIIISLAMNYHPYDLNFILIDYKGGGMADVFQGMPHLVGTITNLGGNETTRALLSIKSELVQRQKIFSKYQVNNIDKYQKLYHSGKIPNMPKVPHLVLIADEFAELKQDQPEFMGELVSAARVGRSLGIHLILATQKPAGVVDDQIWSNSKFKICLKVQDTSDSNDVIKKPDAAMLKLPGRAYLQVGNDEIFELFQSAYSGADYVDDNKVTEHRVVKRIYQIGVNGKREKIYPQFEEKTQEKEYTSQLEEMVHYISGIYKDLQLDPIEGPWKPSLSASINLADILHREQPFDTLDSSTGQDIVFPLGYYDDPRNQRQELFVYNPKEDDNLCVYGSSGTGKSHILNLLGIVATLNYTAQDVIVYGLDFGGASLSTLDEMPLCSGVINIEDEGKLNHLLFKLEGIQTDRKERFRQERVDNIYQYRDTVEKIPLFIIMIDNYYALKELYEDQEERLGKFIREGNRFGIYFIITSLNPTLLPYRTAINFKSCLTYELNDESDYNIVVGRTEGLVPAENLGRGLIKSDHPMEVQIADYIFKDLPYEKLYDVITERYKEREAIETIPTMNDKIDYMSLNNGNTRENADATIYIGQDFDSLEKIAFNMKDYFSLLVCGDFDSAKYRLTHLLLKESMKSEYFTKGKIYIYDNMNKELTDTEIEEVAIDLNLVGDMFDFTIEMKEVLDTRNSALVAVRTNPIEKQRLIDSFEPILFVLTDVSQILDGDDYDLTTFFENCVTKYRHLNIHFLMVDRIDAIESSYGDFTKNIKNEGNAILLGSIKEQNAFTVKTPYSMKETLETPYDGYFIHRNKYKSARFVSI